MREFAFRWAPPYRALAFGFGVTPGNARVIVDADRFVATFGPWRVETPMSNVCDEPVVTGPYAMVKTAGPARLSMTDRGLTFATNGERGVCVCFHSPVRGLDPFGKLRHPGLTVTVEDIDGLVAALTTRSA